MKVQTGKKSRKERRAEQANDRRTVRKGEPFGRVAVTDFLAGPDPHDDRIEYMHTTKGPMSRRDTPWLTNALIRVS